MRSALVSPHVLVLAALSLSACAQYGAGVGGTVETTQPRSESQLPPFSELDQDGDGRLSRQEAAQVDLLRQQFQTADTDQDGSIDAAEFSAFERAEGVVPGGSNGSVVPVF